jgi:hypothetical protein
MLDGQQEDAMRTLRELAETYEQWAAEAEALADQMMAGLDTERKDIQVKQVESAQLFLGEAERLRKGAARIRETWPLQPPLLEKENTLPYFRSRSVTR